MEIKTEKEIAIINGNKIDRYTLTNNKGISVSILNLGGIISSILVPDKSGNEANIVIGFDDANLYNCDEYLSNYPYCGAICGRVANRISNGSFKLNDTVYELNKNNNGSHLHGGTEGFDKKIWDVIPEQKDDVVSLHLSYTSPDNEENYPGKLSVNVDYILSDNNTFSLSYHASTNKATPVNLTNHTYFNLTGNQKDISKMQIKVNASKYTPLNENLIPTGDISKLKDTPYDLSKTISFDDGFKKLPQGYDLNYILDGKQYLKQACILTDPESGRTVIIYTSQPAVQVYSGYFLPEINNIGGKFSGVAIETQHYPDSPNNPQFPSIILEPQQYYNELTIWKLK